MISFSNQLFNASEMILKMKKSINNACKDKSIATNAVAVPNYKNVFFEITIDDEFVGQIEFKVKQIFS